MKGNKKPTPPSSENGATPAVCITGKCPLALKNAMTEAEAQSFMDEFKKTDVPFDYPVDCCYARARIMCDKMEKKGFASEKLWSEGNLKPKKPDGNAVTFPNQSGSPQTVTWHYHVAPIVNVVQPNGSVARRILDPSLSDKPLSETEWKALCGVSPTDTVDKITPPNEHYPFSPKYAGKDYPVKEAEEQLEDHRASRDRNRAEEKRKGK